MYENGVYFDLPAENYHADPALGATSLKALIYDPALYWFESGFNPLRQEEQPTKARIVGTAVHTMVLDGPEAFKARYRPMPGDEACAMPMKSKPGSRHEGPSRRGPRRR
jgi:hypothetical protein